MARIDNLKRENLSPRQQQLHDDFLKSRPRNTLTGPFSVLIHTPDIAEPADHLVNYYRSNPKLGRRLMAGEFSGNGINLLLAGICHRSKTDRATASNAGRQVCRPYCRPGI